MIRRAIQRLRGRAAAQANNAEIKGSEESRFLTASPRGQPHDNQRNASSGNQVSSGGGQGPECGSEQSHALGSDQGSDDDSFYTARQGETCNLEEEGVTARATRIPSGITSPDTQELFQETIEEMVHKTTTKGTVQEAVDETPQEVAEEATEDAIDVLSQETAAFSKISSQQKTPQPPDPALGCF
ncbi:hypothetical protein ACJZ2D_001222 [Fusarium nematophilum]